MANPTDPWGLSDEVKEDVKQADPWGIADTEKVPAAVSSSPPSQFTNPVADLGRGLVKGAAYGVPQQLAKAYQFGAKELGVERGVETAKAVSDWAEIGLGGKGRPEPGMVEQAGQMTSESVLPSVGLMAAGAGISLLPVPGARIVGGATMLAGKYLTPALFGLSQAQQTRETAAERGVDEGVTPYVTGGVEAVGETLGTMAFGRVLGPLGKIGKEVFSKLGAAGALKGSIMGFLKQLTLDTMPTEIGTEMGQGYLQALAEKRAGIRPEADPWKEAVSVIGPTAIMTVLTGGAAHGARQFIAAKQSEILASPIDKNAENVQDLMIRRMNAAGGIEDMIAKENPELKEQWRKYAEQKIRNNEPIDITAPLDSLSLQIDQQMGALKGENAAISVPATVIKEEPPDQVVQQSAQERLPLEDPSVPLPGATESISEAPVKTNEQPVALDEGVANAQREAFMRMPLAALQNYRDQKNPVLQEVLAQKQAEAEAGDLIPQAKKLGLEFKGITRAPEGMDDYVLFQDKPKEEGGTGTSFGVAFGGNVAEALERARAPFLAAEKEKAGPTAEVTVFPGITFDRKEQYLEEARQRGYPDARFTGNYKTPGDIVASAPEGGVAPAGRRGQSDKEKFIRQFYEENLGKQKAEGGLIDATALTLEAEKAWANKEAGGSLTPSAQEKVVNIEAANEAVNPNPSLPQKEAGNYAKGHPAPKDVQGLDLSVETKAGGIRTWKDGNGVEGSTKITYDYGQVNGTKARDGEGLDFYRGPNPESDKVFVVVQQDPKTKQYDEHKSMLFFDTAEDAMNGYLKNYDASGPDRVKNIIPMSMDQFKQWIKGDIAKELKRPPKLEGKGDTTVREKIKELKLSKEVKAGIDKIKSIAQRLGNVNIGEIKSLDESRQIDYSTPEGRELIDAWDSSVDGSTPEGKQMKEEFNEVRSGNRIVYIAGQHAVHKISTEDGGSKKQSDITFYRGHTTRDAYHEGGHALHAQGYLRDKFPTDSIEDREGAARYVEQMLSDGKDAELMEVLKPAPVKTPAGNVEAARPPPAEKKVKGSESLPMFNLKTKKGTINNPAMVIAKLKNDNPLESQKQIEKIAKKAGQWREVTKEGWANIMNALRKAPTVGELAATGYAGRAARWWYQDDEKFFKGVLGKDAYKFFGVMAATSPQSKAETENIRYGVNAWTDYVNLRKELGREPNREEITELVGKMDVGMESRRGGVIRALSGDQLGKSADTLKTRFYHNALFGIELGAVLDIWHGRGMGQLKFQKEGSKIALGQDFGDSIVYSVLSDRMDKAAETLNLPQSASQASQWTMIKALWDRMGNSKEKRKYGGIEALKSITNKDVALAGNYTTGIANYFKEGHPIIDKIVDMGIPREEIAKLKTAVELLEERGIDPKGSVYHDSPPAIQKELERLAVRLEKTRDVIDTLKAQEAQVKRNEPALHMSLETTHGPFAGLPWTKRLAMHNEIRKGPLKDAVIKALGMTFGLKVTGIVDGPGDWYNPKTDKVEINPNFTVLMAVPPGKTKKELAKQIKGFGATLAYITRQAAVGFTHPVVMEELFETQGGPVVVVDIGRVISKEQAAALSKAMAETFPADSAFKVPTSNGFIITMPKFDDTYPLSYADFSRNVLKSLDKAGINNVKGIKYFEKDILEGGDYYEGRRDGENVAGGISAYTAEIRDSGGPRGVVRADKLLSRTDAIKEKYVTGKIRKELQELEESRGSTDGQAGVGKEGVQEGVDFSLRTKLSKKEAERVAQAIAKDPSIGTFERWKNKTVTLTHWSKEPNLTKTDPKKHGTGYAGEERKGKSAYPDLWVPRTYYGYEKYTAEPGLGRYRYQAEVPGNSIYDAWEDPLKLYPSAEETRKLGYYTGTAQGMIHEQRILAAGFKGYAYDQSQAAAIFSPETVTKVEASEKTVPQTNYSIRTMLSSMMSSVPGRSALAAPSSTNQRASWDFPEPNPLMETVAKVFSVLPGGEGTTPSSLMHRYVDKSIDLRDVVKGIENFAGRVTSIGVRVGGTIADVINVALKETLYSGRVGKRIADFLAKELNPIYELLAEQKIELLDFEDYIHNRHAKEANDYIRFNGGLQDGGSGIKDADADAYMRGLNPNLKHKYELIAKKVDKITHENAQLLVSYGLETQETVDKWFDKYKHYVPLFREGIGEGMGSGAGFSIQGPASKGRTGSERNVVDILANIAFQRERAITRGEKNIISKALYGLAKLNPNPEFWKIARPSIKTTVDVDTGDEVRVPDLSYKQRKNVVMHRAIEGGKVVERGVEFEVNNERAKRMAESLKNLDMDQLGTILSQTARATRWIASMNTQYNPVFGVTNFIRDMGTAMMNLSTTEIAGKQKDVLRNSIPALKGIYSSLRAKKGGPPVTDYWGKLFEEFQLMGGQTGYRDLFKDSGERTSAIEKELLVLQSGKPLKVKYALIKLVSDYNTAMENAIRLAAYKSGKDKGMSREQAAAMAKGLTVNFNRKGQIATQAGAMYAFFNASVQGTARMAETLAGPAGKRIVAGGMAFGVLQAAMLAAAGMGDDEPPEWVQEKNIVIPTGGKKYITIPMPLGFNVLPNIGRIGAQFAMSGFKDPGKRISRLFGTMLDATNPLGSSGLALQTFTPTVMDPFVALAENKDWTGKKIYREDFSALDPTPGFTRGKEGVSKAAEAVAWGLNMLTGGTNHTPGLASPTPDQISYLVGQITGGVGREIGKTYKTAEALVTGEDTPPHGIPLVGRFYGDLEGKMNQANKFYDNIKMLNTHENEIKGRKTSGETMDDYFSKNPEAQLWKMGNKAENAISELNKKRRLMIEKEAPKDQIKAMENIIAARMKMLNDAVEGMKK